MCFSRVLGEAPTNHCSSSILYISKSLTSNPLLSEIRSTGDRPSFWASPLTAHSPPQTVSIFAWCWKRERRGFGGQTEGKPPTDTLGPALGAGPPVTSRTQAAVMSPEATVRNSRPWCLWSALGPEVSPFLGFGVLMKSHFLGCGFGYR